MLFVCVEFVITLGEHRCKTITASSYCGSSA